ncbi:hypothetical protein E4U42_003909 [Claviceps africana]|uniref:SWIM-type domain-containing protein n=1 Tax=Claviceps africana TaxID=83212 RepID=A0A8K0JC35_9HYPO|nr:hypothetical protein E4U42_003909 [Claviceps africana]
MPLMSRSRVETAPRAALSVNTDIHDFGILLDSQEYSHVSEDGDDDDDDDDDDLDVEEEEEGEEERRGKKKGPTVVTSPTGLRYNLDQLSGPRRNAVQEAFVEPTRITLQLCERIEDRCVFQMIELVPRAVRIREAPTCRDREGDGGEGSKARPFDNSSQISCSCSTEDDGIPCKHRLSVLDMLANATRLHDGYSKPLTMADEGFAQELGDPFQAIADFHLDILADGLHCPVNDRDSYSEDGPDDKPSAKIQDLFASMYPKLAEDSCPDTYHHLPPGEDILVDTNLLLFNARPADTVHDLCRSLSRRADLVLRELDAFSRPASQSSPCSVKHRESADTFCPESVPDVLWATTHFLRIVHRMAFSIQTCDRPWNPSECHSEVQTLVHILASVVAAGDRSSLATCRSSLYSNLIGDRTQADFVIKELELLPETASYFAERLAGIAEKIATLGAPYAYVKRFNGLLRQLRTSSAGAGTKRPTPSEGADWKPPKRIK